MTTSFNRASGRPQGCVLACGLALLVAVTGLAQDRPVPTAPATTVQSVVLTVSGKAEYAKAGVADWVPAAVNQTLTVGDKFRTGEKSRATIRLPNLTVIRVNERTTIEIRKPILAGDKPSLDLKSGATYFFGRGKPGEIDFRTPMAAAAIRGTEFHAKVGDDGQTTITLLEGEMDIASSTGSMALKAGEQAILQSGAQPAKSPVLQSINIIQWALYYPGVLDTAELELSPKAQQGLEESLKAYSDGNLLKAIAAYPSNRAPESDAERLYFAALLLAAGQAQQAEEKLNDMQREEHGRSPSAARPSGEAVQTFQSAPTSVTAAGEGPPALRILSDALRTLIAAVRGQEQFETQSSPQAETSASWLLAESYYLQSRLKLEEALSTARKAVQAAPDFGFAWVRVAELEFSFGRIDAAKAALDKALTHTPLHAQAWALRGFIFAAENRIAQAKEAFEKAISIDANLGNAWLGRGLCRIRQGDREAGREDLQTAAALEPNRSLFRNYLGKAFHARHDAANASRELEQARRLDPYDPTVWLYSALLNFDRHDINRAVAELERSLELNDNRRLYRSGFLLDQDRAVRSANLANLYLAGGLADVSVREASRAVTYDYSNYSAHRFLADSFNALRDPTRFNLRYETVWFNETLLSDLLSPVGAGTLSQHVSQYEYSKLFEADRLGLNSSSEVRSDGQFLQLASQFGTFGNTSYSLDVEYQNNDGVRPNNELSRVEWYSKIKQQLTPHDTIFLLAKYQDFESGDNFQYYDPDHSYRRGFFYDEFQSPYVVGAYHREWSPGMHTLFLAGGFNNEQRFGDKNVTVPLVERNAAGNITRVRTPTFDLGYASDFAFYTAELNQIFQVQRSTLVMGARYQIGEFETRNTLDITTGSPFTFLFSKPASVRAVSEDFERTSGYAYFTQELWTKLHLTAGLTYDSLLYPLNHRTAPLLGVEAEREQLSPKVALVWDPCQAVSVRSMYSQFLGGVSFDESYRLEPTQLAGFSQAYRSIVPESIVGSVAGPRYEVAGAGIDLKLKTSTYAGLQVEWLRSEIDSPVGGFAMPLPITQTALEREIDYTERGLSVYAHQLMGDHWSGGAGYALRNSSLQTLFPQIPLSVSAAANRTERATLHHLNGYLLFNHPSGFFSRFDANWYSQSNRGYSPEIPGDEFPQFDLHAGYRLPRRLGSITLGVLNLNDRDYRLNPLNAYSELPRERVFVAKLKLQF